MVGQIEGQPSGRCIIRRQHGRGAGAFADRFDLFGDGCETARHQMRGRIAQRQEPRQRLRIGHGQEYECDRHGARFRERAPPGPSSHLHRRAMRHARRGDREGRIEKARPIALHPCMQRVFGKEQQCDGRTSRQQSASLPAPTPIRSRPARRCMALPARSVRPGIRRGNAARNARRRPWRTGSGTRSSHAGRSTRSRARTGQGPQPHPDRARASRPSAAVPRANSQVSRPEAQKRGGIFGKQGKPANRAKRQPPAPIIRFFELGQGPDEQRGCKHQRGVRRRRHGLDCWSSA